MMGGPEYDPARVFNEGTQQYRGDNARMASSVGAIATSDLVKSTLGPKGMDKMLQSMSGFGDVTVTNDGATILKSLAVDNAAAKVLIDISKTQDETVGDGTTSVCVMAGELLRRADRLSNHKVHPQTIVEGWRLAVDVARKALEESAVSHAADADAFRADLLNIARTTLSSKMLDEDKEMFAKLAVDAVMRLEGSADLSAIQIIRKAGGTLGDSFLADGFILDKSFGVGQPKRIENAKVMVANTPMDTDKIKIYSTQVKTDSMDTVAAIESAEKEKMKKKVEKILAHGCNVFINRQLIYNLPEAMFAKAGVAAIEHADFEGVERLALVLGADLVSTFDTPEQVTLGTCELIEEVMIGEDRLIKFSGCATTGASTIVLRGAGDHILAEAERSLHDALCVLTQTVIESRTVLGGGVSEVVMADAIEDAAKGVPGKRALAMQAFAEALLQIPVIIAENAGYDAAELLTRMRAEHHKGNKDMGLSMDAGVIGDLRAEGVTESYAVKLQAVVSAAEAAEMILRVDDIIAHPPRQRQPAHPH